MRRPLRPATLLFLTRISLCDVCSCYGILRAQRTRVGDYGAFIWIAAQNTHAGDDGSAMLHALTKCDKMSWCGEIESFNATMTRETWTGGTYHLRVMYQ
eukprot:SAG25_NODE_1425_length_3058_cov_6.484623_4_plen_99_part_00